MTTNSFFGGFQDKIDSTKKDRPDREEYQLNEILAIVQMWMSGLDKKKIAKITGRSKDSLNYKIWEGKVTINEKTQVRSIRKFFFVAPNDLHNNEQRPAMEAIKLLFAHYEEEFKGEQDIQDRILLYKKELQEAAGVTETVTPPVGTPAE